MSQQYDNTNRGALFKSEQKQQDTHADYSGTINVEGKDYYLNAWIKESQAGKKFFSLSVKPKMTQADRPSAKQTPAKPAPYQGRTQDEDGEDLPF